MPYFDPESSYVLCSSVYLLILGVVGYAATRISAYRQDKPKAILLVGKVPG